jgi:TolA-binding protein
MEPFDISVLIQIAGFAVIVGAAAVWLKSSLAKQRHEDLELLAETRGERIKDQDKRIADLEQSVSELRGQMQALQGLKSLEIAQEVVAQLNAQRNPG